MKQKEKAIQPQKPRKVFQPIDIFAYVTLTDVLDEVLKQLSFAELARMTGISHQKTFTIMRHAEHKVIQHVSAYKRALRLKLLERRYFELLAIIAAYPKSTRREYLLKRSFHLLGLLEDGLDPGYMIATSLLYWMDPACSILRNAVEVQGFPKGEAEIPEWVINRTTNLAGLTDAKHLLLKHVIQTWGWLKKIGAVSFDEKGGRWVQAEPVVESIGRASPVVQDIRSGISNMVCLNLLRDIERDYSTERMLAMTYSSLALSSRHFGVLRDLMKDFLAETASNLSYAGNQEDLARLEQTDPVRHAKVKAYLENLKGRGISLESCSDEDVDSVVQLVVSARKLV